MVAWVYSFIILTYKITQNIPISKDSNNETQTYTAYSFH